MDDQDRDNDQSKERVVNFALLIQQIETNQGMEYKLQAQNQGIPDSEIILLMCKKQQAIYTPFLLNVL